VPLMLIKNIFFTLSFFAVLSLTACKDSGSSSSDNPANIDSLELDGTWASNCYQDDNNEYTIDEFSFSGNTFTASYRSYNDSSCSGDLISSESGSGTFSVGDTITTSLGVEAVEIDFRIEFQGQSIEILDLIKMDGNQFHYGLHIDEDTRPIELDYEVTLTKLNEEDSSSTGSAVGLTIFVTESVHSGDFENDPSLVGSSGIAKADHFCNNDSNKPNDSEYKALLVDGVNRDAVSNIDWVLQPSTAYFRLDGLTIATTTPDRIFDVAFGNLENSPGREVNGFFVDTNYVFTGIVDSGDFSAGDAGHCNQWSSMTNESYLYGRMWNVGDGAFSVGPTNGCDNKLGLYCVEQP